MIVHPSPPSRAPRARGESAVGLVEVIVVVLIILVLGTITVRTMSSARSDGDTAVAITTARTVGEAIDQFQGDHGGRLPGPPGSADWQPPNVTGSSPLAWRSPVDEANGRRPYARAAALEPILDGRIAVVRQDGTVAPGGAQSSARIRYLADPARGVFALDVSVRRNGELRPNCYVSSVEGTPSLPVEATRPC